MEKYEMVAIQRRSGRILLTTLNESTTLWVSEINSNSFGFHLGDMLEVTMDNDIPTKFKITYNTYNITFEVLGQNVIMKGCYARIMSDKNGFYFQSPIFGKMNSVITISPYLEGTSQLVVIGYRNEEDRSDGMPYIWNAYIDKSKEISNDQSQSSSKEEAGGSSVNQLRKKFENGNSSVPKFHKSMQNLSQPSSGVQQSARYSSDDLPRLENKKSDTTQTVEGIVVAKNEKGNFYYVWTKDSYPGKDVKLFTTPKSDLKVSDWVRMHVTDVDFKRCFPLEPTPETSQYDCRSYTKIDARLTTSPTIKNNNVTVTIPNFVKSNDSLYNDVLGHLIDDGNRLREEGVYKIIVARRERGETPSGEKSVWYITGAQKLDNGGSISKGHHFSVDSSPSSSPSSNLRKSMQNLSMNHHRSSEESFEKNHVSNKTTSITGIVVVKSESFNYYYVWAKECYPGKVVKLWSNSGVDLTVSDWVKMEVSEADFERCFPSEPTANTPQFECRSYNKMSKPLLKTEPTISGKSVKVTIPNFKKSGETLFDSLLGYLIDDGDQLKEDGTYKITVARKFPSEATNGKRTVWNIIKATKQTPTRPVKPAESQRVPKNKAIPKVEKVTEKKLYESGICTGVVTSISEIDGTKKYYCWLIEKHTSTCMHDSNIKLFQGDFFESKFKKTNQGQWNHINKSEIKPIRKVITFENHENSIKFIINVNRFISGVKIEVEHDHFGKILDIWNKLPKFALYQQSIKISIIQHKVENRYRWVVFSVIE